MSINGLACILPTEFGYFPITEDMAALIDSDDVYESRLRQFIRETWDGGASSKQIADAIKGFK